MLVNKVWGTRNNCITYHTMMCICDNRGALFVNKVWGTTNNCITYHTMMCKCDYRGTLFVS